jgi:hypothetical protein
MPTLVGKIFTLFRVELAIKIMLVHTIAAAGFVPYDFKL